MEVFSLIGKTEEKLPESLKLQEPVKNLQENLHFMKDLNQLFTYLQLPVQMENQDIHSELYVFTNKKALRAKKELSVLLHLDMPNLGSLNIHVTLEHNMVKAKFYPEEKAAKAILTDNVTSLDEALRKKGYLFSYEVMDAYQKPDFVKDFIEQNAEESSPARYSFDIRA
jgi:flagellar hook-length control protein FliK